MSEFRYTYNDVPQMKPSDVSFSLTLILHAMSPPNTKTAGPSGTNVKPVAEIRTGSLTFTGTRDTKTSAKINSSLYQVAFLALKIMSICFENELTMEWMKIGRTMRELGKRNEAASYLWDFLDFVVTHRTTLYILMQPFIFLKLAQPPISDFERSMHTRIRNKMRSIDLPLPKSKGALLMELAQEMKVLKEELDESTESSSEPKKQDSTPTCQVTSETQQPRHQRHSLIGLFTGEGHHGSKAAPAHDLSHSQIKESSTSTSHVSSPNQGNIISSEGHDTNVNGSSTPCNVPDRSSQRSSVSDDHGTLLTKSESLMFHKAHKLRFVSSVELRHSSGETSTTPLSPASPVDDSSGETYPNKSRLQRVKPQSRKTFRLKRSRKGRSEMSHTKLDSGDCSPPTPQHSRSLDISSPPLTPPVIMTTMQTEASSGAPPGGIIEQQRVPTPTSTKQAALSSQPEQTAIQDPHRLRIATRGKVTEGSWDEDSAISQTSSTSGYRESYPVVHLKESLETSPKAFPPLASPDINSLPSTSSATTANNFFQMDNSSPDCSLNENGEKTALLGQTERSSSQHSLLMIFEQQDETTFM